MSIKAQMLARMSPTAVALREHNDARRKAKAVKKLLMLAELIARDECNLTYHNMCVEGAMIPWGPDVQWTKELLWGGPRTITLTLCVRPQEAT